MEKKCNHKNLLVRGGTSQPQRLLKTLQKDYVQIDEHSYADLILFAKKFSKHLHYYNLDHNKNGNWEDFFSRDVSFLVAFIADNDMRTFDQAFQKLLKSAQDEVTALGADLSDLPNALSNYKKLFDFIFSLASLLDQQVDRLPSKIGLKAFAAASILQSCMTPIKNLLGFYQIGESGNSSGEYIIIDTDAVDPFPLNAHLPQKYSKEVIADGLNLEWIKEESLLNTYVVLSTNDFYYAFGTNAPATPTTAQHVQQWVKPSFKAIESVYHSLSKVFLKIQTESINYLEETLGEWRDHSPHIGLYLSFLKLFRFAQNNLNNLKEDHVNFYYKEVLRLQERPAQPDQVFAIIELGKQIDDYLLEQNTAFKGGKDSDGNELIYKATRDTAINKASIAQIKSIYQSEGKIFETPISNSDDGLGEPVSTENGAWKPFGKNILGEVGFAIASPNLFLKGGERSISIVFSTLGKASLSTSNRNHLKFLFTGEEGWIEKRTTEDILLNTNKIIFKCDLDANDGKIVPYDFEIHGGTFQTKAPVVKILFEDGGKPIYNQLKELRITDMTTEVSVKGLKDFLVQNEVGRLDLSSPVFPFGGTAKVGSSFIVGSKEVFQKKISNDITLNIDWDGLDDIENTYLPISDSTEPNSEDNKKSSPKSKKSKPWLGLESEFQNGKVTDGSQGSQVTELREDYTQENFNDSDSYHNIRVQYEVLKKNKWEKKDLINIINKRLTDPESISITEIDTADFLGFDYSKDALFTPKSKDGFARFTLKDSFGQKEYQRNYTLALIELSKVGRDLSKIKDSQFQTGLKDPPYVPSFKELSLDYSANSRILFNENIADHKSGEQFFHLHAFGQKEVLNQEPYLFPQFNHEGELMIGITDLAPQQSVSVLFQIAEGTANPLKAKQEVDWFYLYKNNWIKFNDTQDADFNDQTNGLLQSGLVTFFLPKLINKDNTWMEAGHIWLKASVRQDVDAICDIIDIKAQAIRLQFEFQNNLEDILNTPLPPKKIKKLLEPIAAVKKIEQPYTSFNGQIKEQTPQFHKRISERLRHKDRAISIWDYEHLILENFPEVYRVKCLNHTQLKSLSSTRKELNGIAPGYVTIVTIPDLQHKNAVAKLKPSTSIDTLNRIGEFLKKRITPHAKIEVMNPLFEEIKLDFQVQFRDNIDFTLFKKKLNLDIQNFLSPWAFKSEVQRELEFGGKIYKSVVLNFMEELSYVDFITNFKMFQLSESNKDLEEVIASTPRSILVSVPEHQIREVDKKCL